MILSALQDLSCAECREILGLRCDSAPENHLLKRYEECLQS